MMDKLKKILETLGIDGEIAEVNPESLPPELLKEIVETLGEAIKASPEGKEINDLVKKASDFLKQASITLATTTLARNNQKKGLPFYDRPLKSEFDKVTHQINLQTGQYMSPDDGDIEKAGGVEAYTADRVLAVLESMLQQSLKNVAEIRKAHNKPSGPDISPSMN